MSTARITTVLFDLGDTLIRTGKQWMPGARDSLGKLRDEGIRLGLISNTGTLTRDQLLTQLPAGFDFAAFEPALVILSSEAGVEKPDPAIFRLAVERAGIPAAKILFCTESPLDALVAQREGMTALRTLPAPDGDVKDVPDLIQRYQEL